MTQAMRDQFMLFLDINFPDSYPHVDDDGMIAFTLPGCDIHVDDRCGLHVMVKDGSYVHLGDEFWKVIRTLEPFRSEMGLV